eukprot:scaffold102497_cov43-Cyclotella_meneghiniana.AAC.1
MEPAIDASSSPSSLYVARPNCCSAHVCGLLARYDPSKNSRCSLWDQTSLARPSMFDGTLLEMARSRARCALGLESEIIGKDLGAVPYKNLLNRSPISPNGPIAMGIKA